MKVAAASCNMFLDILDFARDQVLVVFFGERQGVLVKVEVGGED